MEKAEEDWGRGARAYRDDDGKLLSSIQYGPAQLFPPAAELSPPAVGRRCSRHLRLPRLERDPWVEQSVALSSPRFPRHATREPRRSRRSLLLSRGESTYKRFPVHRTVFPRDFRADFGFHTVRTQGRVELARLGLGGLALRRWWRECGQRCCGS